jgi:hypothetical protein
MSLHVRKLSANSADNAKRHHTSGFGHLLKQETLVIRRGEPWEIQVEFDRPFDEDLDDLRFLLERGKLHLFFPGICIVCASNGSLSNFTNVKNYINNDINTTEGHLTFTNQTSCHMVESGRQIRNQKLV